MTNVILFDNEIRDHLLPLTYLRPMGALRVGLLTIQEKWRRHLGLPVSFLTQDYLAEKFPMEYGDSNLLINGSALPTSQLVRLITQMSENQAFLLDGELIAAKLSGEQVEQLVNDEDFGELAGIDLHDTEMLKINRLPDIFQHNDAAIRSDFALLTKGRKSEPLPSSNRLIGPAEALFIEPGARVEGATLNTTTGPIYIGREAEVMEGALVRGPLGMAEHAVLKMGAKIYGATTLGPYCKVGGEVNNVVFQGYANKAHDGFLGNSVIGQWCNLGADSNCSNLKNTYEEVKLWNYPEGRFMPTGTQFCGLIMGDHSKCGINTMFNTGTVIGVSSNIFGSGFPRNFVPSFAWGGANHSYSTYRTSKAFETVERVLARRGKEFTVQDRLILLRVFEETAKFRGWEKKQEA
ncbi:MAG: GlmU family protein [Lewinella sp.]|nr:GlmU family protein [Lewinella sp.]